MSLNKMKKHKILFNIDFLVSVVFSSRINLLLFFDEIERFFKNTKILCFSSADTSSQSFLVQTDWNSK